MTRFEEFLFLTFLLLAVLVSTSHAAGIAACTSPAGQVTDPWTGAGCAAGSIPVWADPNTVVAGTATNFYNCTNTVVALGTPVWSYTTTWTASCPNAAITNNPISALSSFQTAVPVPASGPAVTGTPEMLDYVASNRLIFAVGVTVMFGIGFLVGGQN